MKIYLDDTRDTPDGWVRAYWPAEVIELLSTNTVEEISLDHDLGDSFDAFVEHRAEITGDDVITWIMEQVVCNDFVPPIIHIHTANRSAEKKMLAGVERIYQFANVG